MQTDKCLEAPIETEPSRFLHPLLPQNEDILSSGAVSTTSVAPKLEPMVTMEDDCISMSSSLAPLSITMEGTPPTSPSQWEDFEFNLELATAVLKAEAVGCDNGDLVTVKSLECDKSPLQPQLQPGANDDFSSYQEQPLIKKEPVWSLLPPSCQHDSLYSSLPSSTEVAPDQSPGGKVRF